MRLYCEMLPSLLVGVPSKYHKGRPRMPVAPPSCRRIDEVMRRLECRVEIFVEQIHRLHDVHVAIDEAVALFHVTLPLMPDRAFTGELCPQEAHEGNPIPTAGRR